MKGNVEMCGELERVEWKGSQWGGGIVGSEVPF